MIILGIDPGIATVGFGVVSSENGKPVCVDFGIISTPKTDSISKRLFTVSEGLTALIRKFKPDAVAVEELFFNNNQKTAIMVAEARGVILCTAVREQCDLYEYTPLQIKQGLTGYGRADKQQMQQMVKILLKLSTIPKPDDAADALAVALCHAQTNRFAGQFRA